METITPQTPAPGAKKNMVMGILAYLGIFVIIPILAAKEEPFVKFHIKQGLVLLGIEIILWLLGSWLWQLSMVIGILNLAVLVLIIIGIVNVAQGSEKELPLVGSLAKYVTFI